MTGSEREHDIRRLRGIIDAMADPVVVVKPDYRVELVNRRARELFPQAERVEMLCYELSHHGGEPCAGAEHPCPMREARDTGKTAKVIHEHYDEQGCARFVEITASPLKNSQGAFAGVVESQREVTARILAERKLAKYAAELKDSNSLKDLFIDIMRHDLMNPVTGIITTALCALEGDPPAPLKDDLQEIARQTRKIIDLIQNASVLAHLEGGGELPFSDADLGRFAETAIREQRGAAQERDMRIELRGVSRAPARVNPLIGDVFANLISNAAKYGAEGTGIVVRLEPAGAAWRISVADRGPGVPDGDKQAIFTRFTRRAKEGVKGTGLGLSIVRKIVAAHGGRAWVEDNPGGGSVFIVELPRHGD